MNQIPQTLLNKPLRLPLSWLLELGHGVQNESIKFKNSKSSFWGGEWVNKLFKNIVTIDLAVVLCSCFDTLTL